MKVHASSLTSFGNPSKWKIRTAIHAENKESSGNEHFVAGKPGFTSKAHSFTIDKAQIAFLNPGTKLLTRPLDSHE
jgi:hypothetical protein